MVLLRRITMRSTYNYRLLGKATWGIAIDLTAEYESPGQLPKDAVKIVDGLWLACDQTGLTEKEEFFLRLGLGLVSDAILNAMIHAGVVLIRIVSISYNPTDYQPEGLAAAVAKWAALAFQFEVPDCTAKFDKTRRRYVYPFEPVMDETGSELTPIVDTHPA